MKAPDPGHYVLCNHVTGAVDAGVNVSCVINAQGRHIGRYVIIQIVSAPGVTSDILTLCEVSVYAGKM